MIVKVARVRFVCFFLAFYLSTFSLSAAERGAYHQHFSLKGDAVLWKRSNHFKRFNQTLVQLKKEKSKEGGDKPAVIDPAQSGIESSQLLHNMHDDLGVRIGIEFVYDRQTTWSISYTGFLHWEGREVIEKSGKLSLPFPSDAISSHYQDADRASALYSSKFYSVDVTQWKYVTPRYVDAVSISWLGGLQFFNLDESIKLDFTKKNVTHPYQVHTRSRSIGPFFGFHFECNPHSYITLGLSANVGGLVNQSNRKIEMLAIHKDEPVRGYGSRIASPGYFISMRPMVDIHLIKFFNCIIGYDFLYIDGVAVADRQIVTEKKGEGKPNDKGHVIFCGLYAGIQLNF